MQEWPVDMDVIMALADKHSLFCGRRNAAQQ
jgi:hypothetical protein